MQNSFIAYSDKALPIINVFVFMISACIGSFLNVCIWRIPRSESIVFPPSHCPKCNKLITLFENIPIISWIILGGKCSKCKLPISPKYIFIELMTGLCLLGIWLKLSNIYIAYSALPVIPTAIFALLVSAMITCVFIDIEHLIVPNSITIPMIILALILSLIFPASQSVNIAPIKLYNLQFDFVFTLFNAKSGYFPELVSNIRYLSAINSLLGIIFGYIIITFIIELGKKLWGKKKYYANKTSIPSVYFNCKSLIIEGVEYPFDDIFSRESDEIILYSGNILLDTSANSENNKNQIPDKYQKIIIKNNKTILIDEKPFSYEEIEGLQGKLTSWLIPREVMGYGDAKFLAMVGAFLGPEAVFISLMLASIIGTFAGTLFVILRKKEWYSQLPFVPYLAISTYLWLLFSYSISKFYINTLLF